MSDNSKKVQLRDRGSPASTPAMRQQYSAVVKAVVPRVLVMLSVVRLIMPSWSAVQLGSTALKVLWWSSRASLIQAATVVFSSSEIPGITR